MRLTFNRRPVTALLLSALEPTGGDTAVWTVDVARKPPAGGWQGDIGESAFAPYAVLTPLSTGDLIASAQDAGFGSGAPATLPYTITCVGVSSAQTEALADLLRERLAAVAGDAPTDSDVAIMSALPARVGALQRIDQDHGEYWVQTDLINVNVSP